jgi:hypothetical protein
VENIQNVGVQVLGEEKSLQGCTVLLHLEEEECMLYKALSLTREKYS